MTDQNVFVRLADVEAALGMPAAEIVADVERFTLTDGHETNEAGISEMRDREGLVLYHDGKRMKH
jgi:hypothetical protein